MSTEIKGSVFGLFSGVFKKVASVPVVIKPCEHYVEKKGIFKDSIIRVHGKQDGSGIVEKTGV